MIKKENENMTEYTILPEDGWVKVASSGDQVTFQNITAANATLQVVDAEPEDDIDWGFVLYPKIAMPFSCTHDVYARANARATVKIVVQKD